VIIRRLSGWGSNYDRQERKDVKLDTNVPGVDATVNISPTFPSPGLAVWLSRNLFGGSYPSSEILGWQNGNVVLRE
jgi:hypothetical protein